YPEPFAPGAPGSPVVLKAADDWMVVERSEDRRLDEQGERDMSAAAARLSPGEGALGGEVVGDEVPGRDRRAETRVPGSARRAHLEHLAALPAEAEAQVAPRLLHRLSHAGAAAAQLGAV